MLIYSSAMSCFFNSKIHWDHVILFEDSIQLPRETATRLLTSMGIDVEKNPYLLENALEAAKIDSQVSEWIPS